ncbi:hypothetical protein MRB53_003282 [Persea americana]|uniref:Uncharacterized protein n=1 Tax=Persea americana TaxID=3435 RepID=A0ACC2MX67_PERAE|nr:hypothetical protein MRB53_003282 [Persea americana]
MGGWTALIEVLNRPTEGDAWMEFVFFLGPLWVAVLFGIFTGWAWKPKWACLAREKFDGGKISDMASLPSIAMGLISSFSSFVPWISEGQKENQTFEMKEPMKSDNGKSKIEENEKVLLTKEDLEHMCQLVEERDEGPAWQQMMERSMPNMRYQAWKREPKTGPPQYRSRTVLEDATPELVRDFFWDDEFRSKWDDMLVHSETLEECPISGAMVVQWIRKFPFFCSDREYIIGRRIWESGRTYYCVTKGVPCPSVPRRNKPRRVDLYYSSWCIRAVESNKGDGQLTACEVLLFHHEEMGIPWEIAKMGVRQGMWGAVKKIEPGLRAYQMARRSGAPLSRCGVIAQINTKFGTDYLTTSKPTSDSSEVKTLNSTEKSRRQNIPKLIVIGGAVALACSIDRGLLTKAFIFGVARRFPMLGRRS